MELTRQETINALIKLYSTKDKEQIKSFYYHIKNDLTKNVSLYFLYVGTLIMKAIEQLFKERNETL